MAFTPYKYLKGQPPLLELPASNGGSSAAYTVGQALVFSSGKLTTVAENVGQDTDEGIHFICMEDVTVTTDATLITVMKADENIEWETQNGAAATDLAIGAKYIIDTDAKSIVDTTTKGCFMVTYTAGTDDGDVARGIFVE